MTPIPILLMLQGMARLKDSLYTIGGMTTSFFADETAICRKYIITTNAWSTIASLPVVMAGNGAFGYQDSLIYSIGGFISGSSTAGNQIYLYNVFNNTWRTATPLPSARCLGACAISGDTINYVGGGTTYFAGYTNVTFKGLISQTNRSIITWVTGQNYPGISVIKFQASPWGCRGVILSGGGGLNSGECYVYSPGTNMWTQQAYTPIGVVSPVSGSVSYSSGIWKLILASGSRYPDTPYVINNTQIFTDTLCPGPIGITQHNSQTPTKYSLSQNYPNPFNPTTEFSFALAKAGNVKLAVFDILGKEIQTLVNEYKKAGIYEIEFNASHLSSGIYFYKIKSGDFTETKKMLIIK